MGYVPVALSSALFIALLAIAGVLVTRIKKPDKPTPLLVATLLLLLLVVTLILIGSVYALFTPAGT